MIKSMQLLINIFFKWLDENIGIGIANILINGDASGRVDTGIIGGFDMEPKDENIEEANAVVADQNDNSNFNDSIMYIGTEMVHGAYSATKIENLKEATDKNSGLFIESYLSLITCSYSLALFKFKFKIHYTHVLIISHFQPIRFWRWRLKYSWVRRRLFGWCVIRKLIRNSNTTRPHWWLTGIIRKIPFLIWIQLIRLSSSMNSFHAYLM